MASVSLLDSSVQVLVYFLTYLVHFQTLQISYFSKTPFFLKFENDMQNKDLSTHLFHK